LSADVVLACRRTWFSVGVSHAATNAAARMSLLIALLRIVPPEPEWWLHPGVERF
jgi:hypothetical protein